MTEHTEGSVETVLRDGLVQADAVIATARPILRHLLAIDDHALFSDELVARIRGMITHVARELLFAHAEAGNERDGAGRAADRLDELAHALFEDGEVLAHAHGLAVEGQLAERLQDRSGIDAVLPPLVQELAGSGNEELAALAMMLLAAQARFMQHSRRMELPLGELPGDLFHSALLVLRAVTGDEAGERAERRLRETYDENAGRLALLTRLTMAMGRADEALAIAHAGLAIFATALAQASGQPRDLTVLSFADLSSSRLALVLRAAGLGRQAVEEHLFHLYPAATLPDGFDGVSAEQAAALLAASQLEAAD